MTSAIIIAICILLLIAYLFDLTNAKTKIPSVILLLLLGWLVKTLAVYFNVHVPDLARLLPALGTIGLILIVLEGSLELEFNPTKIPLIKKSFFVSLVSIVALVFCMALLFQNLGGYTLKISLLNAIPFVVISSSIAIPSVINQSSEKREFIIYESSFSDIIGILCFNFIAFNERITLLSFGGFGLNLVLIIAISFIATISLALLLSKIDHHIKYAPIVLLIILIYEAAKHYNLPSLLFILLFGLFLGNVDELRRFSWMKKINLRDFNSEVHKFKDLITEGTFLVRSVFFILFGYLMETSEIFNGKTFFWALAIVGLIIIIRFVALWSFGMLKHPLLFIAPRGLITILLFISVIPEKQISFVNKSLVIQVIIITGLFMMIGLMTDRKVANGTKDIA